MNDENKRNDRTNEENDKKFIEKRIKLIQDFSSLSNVQQIVFMNILAVEDPEMFDILKDVTEWESDTLDRFIKDGKKGKR